MQQQYSCCDDGNQNINAVAATAASEVPQNIIAAATSAIMEAPPQNINHRDEDPHPAATILRQKLGELHDLQELVDTKLFGESTSTAAVGVPTKKNTRNNDSREGDRKKQKPSNFWISLLKIGSWKKRSVNRGDLVGKCYFAQRKLIWEILEGGLKSKIEIQWTHVSAIRTEFSKNLCALEVQGNRTLRSNSSPKLTQPPLFYKESDPKPQMHTSWHLVDDFTGGEASVWRRHYLEFPEGEFESHYEKLLQYDDKLNMLSKELFPISSSPFFPTVDYSQNSNAQGSSQFLPTGFNRYPCQYTFPSPEVPNLAIPRSVVAATYATPTWQHFPSPTSVVDRSYSNHYLGCGAMELNSLDSIYGNLVVAATGGIPHRLQQELKEIGEHMTSDPPMTTVDFSNEQKLKEIEEFWMSDPTTTADFSNEHQWN